MDVENHLQLKERYEKGRKMLCAQTKVEEEEKVENS